MDYIVQRYPDMNAGVWLKNLQNKVLFNHHLLRLHSSLLLHLLAPESAKFTVSIACVDEDEIRQLNWVYRKVDQPTDVLSFPYHEVTETME